MYITITEDQYHELANGGTKYEINNFYIESKVTNLSERDKRLLSNTGYDIDSAVILDNIKSTLLFDKNNPVPLFIIIKLEDEYFIVNRINQKKSSRTFSRNTESNKYYKCDQIDGLLNCINDANKNR
jgi:hypothetical protein